MFQTKFSKLLFWVTVCGLLAVPAHTFAGHGGGHGGGGHGGGGHFGGGGGHMGGGHFGGGGGHVGSFGGGHSGGFHMGGGAPVMSHGGGFPHTMSAPHAPSFGHNSAIAHPSLSMPSHSLGSRIASPSTGRVGTSAIQGPRISNSATGSATIGRHAGGSFLANHFSASPSGLGGNLSGRGTASVNPAVSTTNSFAARHFSGTGFGGRTATNNTLGGSLATRNSQGSLGTRSTTSVVNNYNYYGGRFGFGFPYYGYGFGYPFYGYGFGRGLLYSLLYGIGGYGYGGYGYGGYGGYGYGYGYPSYGFGYSYNPYCSYNAYGYGVSPYSSYSTIYSTPVTYTTALPTAVTGLVAPTSVVAQPQNPTPTNSNPPANAGGFGEQGEAAFKAGDYKGAVYALKHALVDSQNPVLTMMLAQALFATGSYDEAAGATQTAMNMLPKDQWGVVSSNYKELYGSMQDYTDQLRALEKAVSDKPDDPARRFLLGFHYGYLGYPKQSIEQLDKLLKLAPNDQMGKQLHDEMKAKLPKPATPEALPMPQLP